MCHIPALDTDPLLCHSSLPLVFWLWVSWPQAKSAGILPFELFMCGAVQMLPQKTLFGQIGAPRSLHHQNTVSAGDVVVGKTADTLAFSP
jgi:hypothetical protein